MKIVGIGDASFKTDEKAVGGVLLLLLVNQDFTRESLNLRPLYSCRLTSLYRVVGL